MPIMKFSNTGQVIAIALAWTAALVYVDYKKNPRPLREMYAGTKRTQADQNITTPHVSLKMNHLCCSGCLDDVKQALKGLPWVGVISIPDEASLPDQSNTQEKDTYAGYVDVTVKDIQTLDFVELNQKLRATGLTAEHIKFSGIKEYRLNAFLPHICCTVCSKALEKGLFVKGIRATGPLQWLDNAAVSKEHHSVVVAPRPGKEADVTELFEVLDRLGFAPASVKIALPADSMQVTMVGKAGAPVAPTATPGTPAATPGTPAATPGTPAATPGTPAATPGAVAATPGTPAATPGTPAATPGAPAATPGTPAATPAAAGPASATIEGTEVKLSQPLRYTAGEIKLAEPSAAVLQALAKAVLADPTITELILKVGASGDKKAAKHLATERAAELKKELQAAGIPHKNLKVHAHHEPGEDMVLEVAVSRKKHHEKVEEDSQ